MHNHTRLQVIKSTEKTIRYSDILYAACWLLQDDVDIRKSEYARGIVELMGELFNDTDDLDLPGRMSYIYNDIEEVI